MTVQPYTPIKTALDRERLAMLDGPTSIKQFSQKIGKTATVIIRRYREFGWVYVCGHWFNDDTGKWVAMYRAGNRPDVAVPTERPRRERVPVKPTVKSMPTLPIVPLAKSAQSPKPDKKGHPPSVARYFKQNPSASVLLRDGVTYRRGEG